MKMMEKLTVVIYLYIRRVFSRFSWLKFFLRYGSSYIIYTIHHIRGIIFRKKKMWVWVYYFFWQCFSSFFLRRKIIICRLFVLIKKKIKKIVNAKKKWKMCARVENLKIFVHLRLAWCLPVICSYVHSYFDIWMTLYIFFNIKSVEWKSQSVCFFYHHTEWISAIWPKKWFDWRRVCYSIFFFYEIKNFVVIYE